jgi:hypothetical protein
MATPSVITALVADTENMTLGVTPFKLEIKGSPEPRVTATKFIDIDTGKVSKVRIVALAADGVPAQPLSTLDAVARRLLPNARVTAAHKGTAQFYREYSNA